MRPLVNPGVMAILIAVATCFPPVSAFAAPGVPRAAAALPSPAAPEAANSGAAASEVLPLAPPPRSVRLSLKDMGLGGLMTLRGNESEGSVGFGLRRDDWVESARLHLVFTLSPSLLPALSHLKVLFNDELLHTVSLDKDSLGKPQSVDLAIDPRFFANYNRLRFQFIGHYTLECELPSHSSLWATVSNDSRLDLTLRQVALRNDLGLLPLPFFDPNDQAPVVVPFVLAAQAGPGVLRASGAVASWLGSLAAYRGHRFPVLTDALPGQHGVVLATNDSRPAFLNDMPPVDQPTLAMVSHPQVPGGKLLLILGKDDEQVDRAAQALVLGKTALTGGRMEVLSLEAPPVRESYDAPRWLTTRRPVPLSELVQNPGDLQVSGVVLNNSINLSARLAPDLFTWNSKGIPLNLLYHYTPNSVSENGALNVSVNDLFVRSFPLRAKDDAAKGNSSLFLPLLSDGQYQSRAELKVPAFAPGDNRLQLSFQIPQPDVGRCLSMQPPVLHAAVDPGSTLDLTGYRHYMAMPNLMAFGRAGFPFTRWADLSQTSVILASQPGPAELETYLSAMGVMGASTGLPATRFRLLNPSQIAQARGTDVLVISQGDPEGLLGQWRKQIPALIEAGQRTVRPLGMALAEWSRFFNLEPAEQLAPASLVATLKGDGALAAVVGFESPLDGGRSVVALTANNREAMARLGEALGDPGKASQMRGDLAFVTPDQTISYRVDDRYFVGNLRWWQQLWFLVHAYPLALALAGMVTGLLLTFLVYGSLRAMARRRLKADRA